MQTPRVKASHNLWLMRLYYLIYYCGTGSINPFINLFYINRGLSGTEIGLLGTISAISGLISAPFWGRLNDNIRRPRRILQLALSVNSLAYFLISRQDAFLYLAIIVGFNALVSAGVDPMQSTQALGIAAEADAGFGSIRLWGSLGWALAAPLSGFISQKTSLLSAFYAYIFFMLMAALILSFIKGEVKRTPETAPAQKLPMRQVLYEIFQNRELTALLFASAIMWVGTNGMKFEAVYLSQLGANTSIIGWVNTIGAVIEIPMMLVSDRVMHRFEPIFTLIIGYLVYALGLSIIVIHPSVITIVCYRAMGGVGLAFYYLSYVHFIVKRAPSQQSATVLALYSVTFAGIINILASLFSGWIFDLLGAYWLYVIALAGYLLAALIMYLAVARHMQIFEKSKPV